MTNVILSIGLHGHCINGWKGTYAVAPDTFEILPVCHPVGASRTRHHSQGERSCTTHQPAGGQAYRIPL